MSHKSDYYLEDELIELLGEDDYFKLVENFAGLRVYVAIGHWNTPSLIEREVGRRAAEILGKRYGCDYINVPLSREFRANRYRHDGMNNRQIAVRLGMTENGVERIFNRLKKAA